MHWHQSKFMVKYTSKCSSVVMEKFTHDEMIWGGLDLPVADVIKMKKQQTRRGEPRVRPNFRVIEK
jgi:hypothetical protein